MKKIFCCIYTNALCLHAAQEEQEKKNSFTGVSAYGEVYYAVSISLPIAADRHFVYSLAVGEVNVSNFIKAAYNTERSRATVP